MNKSAVKKTEHSIIFHVDVNSAFLSWSAVKALKEHPDSVDLRTIPSAVAGDVETRHGIITAASIPAKRCGIKTAEPVQSALRKCPELVLVKSDFKTYREYSERFFEILRKWSDRVEKCSIDEAYVDMTDSKELAETVASAGAFPAGAALAGVIPAGAASEAAFPPGAASAAEPFPLNAASAIRREVRETLGFTVNVGISVNRILAKTASDFTKPDRTHTLWPEEIPEKFWPMPIGELHGCGAATAERLRGIGINTIGEAAHTDPEILKALLGEKAGIYIGNSANGISSSEVAAEADDAKSYSNETTLAADITRDNYEKEAPGVIRELSYKVAGRLKKDGVYARAIGVSVKTTEFRRRSKQMTLSESTCSEKVIDENAQALMRELLFGENGPFAKGEGVRLIGVTAGNLDHGEYRQISLFDYAADLKREKEEQAKNEAKRQRDEKLNAMLGAVVKKYGAGALHKGADNRDGMDHS